jgi:hypothetical protein
MATGGRPIEDRRRTAGHCEVGKSVFQRKPALGLDPGVDTGSREENASKQKGPVGIRCRR